MPLGILPHFPITLGWKTDCIDVMAVQGPLYFNILLGRYYVYAMKYVVSTFFREIHFPHHGKIVTIDKLSFVKHDYHVTPSHQTSLNVLHVLMALSPSN